jgi:hypothetical protein
MLLPTCGLSRWRRGSDAPHAVADVVGHQQCSGAIDSNPHGTAESFTVRVHEAREDLYWLSELDPGFRTIG